MFQEVQGGGQCTLLGSNGRKSITEIEDVEVKEKATCATMSPLRQNSKECQSEEYFQCPGDFQCWHKCHLHCKAECTSEDEKFHCGYDTDENVYQISPARPEPEGQAGAWERNPEGWGR